MTLKDWKLVVEERYRVVSIYEGWEKYFKSKSSALAYAKSYMRTH